MKKFRGGVSRRELICLLKGTEQSSSYVVASGVLHIGGTNECIGNSG